MQEYDIIECIRAAQNKLAAAENKFLFAIENDVQVAIAELNSAKEQLNRLYEMAKTEGVKGDYKIYKSDLFPR